MAQPVAEFKLVEVRFVILIFVSNVSVVNWNDRQGYFLVPLIFIDWFMICGIGIFVGICVFFAELSVKQ